MKAKIQIKQIREELIGRIRRTVEKQNGCIGTYYKNVGRRYSRDSMPQEEYDTSLVVGIHDSLASAPSAYEEQTLFELYIDPQDGILCGTFKEEGVPEFDLQIESVITDCLPKIIDWLIENGFDTKDKQVVLYCSECGSTDVQYQAWVKPNEGNIYADDISTIDDDENNYCMFCEEHVVLLTQTQMLEQVNDWWTQTDTNIREKITNILLAQFDGGEIPAYESACQAFWDALADEVKIAQWQKWK